MSNQEALTISLPSLLRRPAVTSTSFRQFGCCNRQFDDPLGRPTLTVTAKGLWRRQRHLGWYNTSEDENDTYAEAMADKARFAVESTS